LTNAPTARGTFDHLAVAVPIVIVTEHVDGSAPVTLTSMDAPEVIKNIESGIVSVAMVYTELPLEDEYA
jgi:hypothetical protein